MFGDKRVADVVGHFFLVAVVLFHLAGIIELFNFLKSGHNWCSLPEITMPGG
jgi:hypothetical protein